MGSPEQEAATLRVVGAMVDAAAVEMEALRPEVRLARFENLPPNMQRTVASALHPMLAAMAALLEKSR